MQLQIILEGNYEKLNSNFQFSKAIVLTANMKSDGLSNGEARHCNLHLTSVYGIC
jgi:hypothetical protein